MKMHFNTLLINKRPIKIGWGSVKDRLPGRKLLINKLQKIGTRNLRKNVICLLGPKTGMVGQERFQSDAVPGTYWYEGQIDGEKVEVVFECQKGELEAEVKSGENLLKVAEAIGAVKHNEGFCYEGTCETCVFECQDASEVGSRASKTNDGFIRSCITPVPQPKNQGQKIRIKVLSDEDVWGENML